MRRSPFSLALTTVFLFSSCSTQEVKNTAPTAANAMPAQHSGTPQAASTQPKDGLYPSRGKITKINLDAPSVELDHEEITGVMPPMIMEFYVKDKSLLNGFAVGDRVDFV